MDFPPKIQIWVNEIRNLWPDTTIEFDGAFHFDVKFNNAPAPFQANQKWHAAIHYSSDTAVFDYIICKQEPMSIAVFLAKLQQLLPPRCPTWDKDKGYPPSTINTLPDFTPSDIMKRRRGFKK